MHVFKIATLILEIKLEFSNGIFYQVIYLV